MPILDFHIVLNEVHAQHFGQQIHDSSSQIPLSSTPANLEKKMESRVQAYRRLQATYFPICKKVVVAGIRLSG